MPSLVLKNRRFIQNHAPNADQMKWSSLVVVGDDDRLVAILLMRHLSGIESLFISPRALFDLQQQAGSK